MKGKAAEMAPFFCLFLCQSWISDFPKEKSMGGNGNCRFTSVFCVDNRIDVIYGEIT
jgi:hypothetical protein